MDAKQGAVGSTAKRGSGENAEGPRMSIGDINEYMNSITREYQKLREEQRRLFGAKIAAAEGEVDAGIDKENKPSAIEVPAEHSHKADMKENLPPVASATLSVESSNELQSADKQSTEITERTSKRLSCDKNIGAKHEIPIVAPSAYYTPSIPKLNKLEPSKDNLYKPVQPTKKMLCYENDGKTPLSSLQLNSKKYKEQACNMNKRLESNRNSGSLEVPHAGVAKGPPVSSGNRRDDYFTPCRPVRPVNGVYSVPIISQTNEANKQPRILCTVDMQSHLKTPIYKKTQPKAMTSFDFHVLDSIRDEEELSEEAQPEVKTLGNQQVKDVFKCITIGDEEYVVLKTLGKGGSSEVYHSFNPKTQLECAIKCVDLSQDKNEIGFINEVKALKRLQGCDRIIKLFQFEVVQAEKKLYVVLEKGGRDFAQILREHSHRTLHLPPFMIIYYWMQMLLAVQQIHSQNVIHSDLKPANFIEIQERLKLIDFGISSCVQTDATSVLKTVALGTFGYISPEALCQDKSNAYSPHRPKYKISYKSDVWSLGCILYQLIYKRTPFAHITHNHAKLAVIMDPHHKINYPPAEWAPPSILECVRMCLQFDARKRPSVNDLIARYQDYLDKF